MIFVHGYRNPCLREVTLFEILRAVHILLAVLWDSVFCTKVVVNERNTLGQTAPEGPYDSCADGTASAKLLDAEL
ncbi:MAG: hypothetical protein EA377_08575 [Phycisphaerales bacterium]|nr:MAG: hypothetical protein EA377_08575 [Phycisphaerales bacterium]